MLLCCEISKMRCRERGRLVIVSDVSSPAAVSLPLPPSSLAERTHPLYAPSIVKRQHQSPPDRNTTHSQSTIQPTFKNLLINSQHND